MQNFVRRYIASVWQLELLLFFKRTDRAVSVNEASRALYLEPGVVAPAVRSLADAGVLNSGPDAEVYRYDPKSPALGACVFNLPVSFFATGK